MASPPRAGPARSRVQVGNRLARGLWWRAPLALLLWSVVAAPLVALAAGALTLRRWAAELPAVPDLAAWQAQAPATSLVVAADGTVLAELPFSDGVEVGHRRWITLERTPPRLVQAVLAAEDLRFASHHGVDYAAMVRAALANLRAGRVVEGASTIPQQVARNLLPEELGRDRNLRRKVREALLARQLERRWSKRAILEVYLNYVFLGSNAYGMAAAARAYFDVELAELTLAQHALLASSCRGPPRRRASSWPSPCQRSWRAAGSSSSCPPRRPRDTRWSDGRWSTSGAGAAPRSDRARRLAPQIARR